MFIIFQHLLKIKICMKSDQRKYIYIYIYIAMLKTTRPYGNSKIPDAIYILLLYT